MPLKEEDYRIEYVDRILEPVHGFIDLTQVEKEIIDLPIFKRLQSLKQLSLTNWVFPGAEHTRYMHSLGVMYIADLMAVNLRTVDFGQYFNEGQRQLIRLAGLLHDIGHYPLSHVTEEVYKDNLSEEESTLYSHNIRVKKNIDNVSKVRNDFDFMKSRYTKPMHHETMGTKVLENDDDIKNIIEKYCPFIDIQDIKDIIVGCVDRNSKISAMVQLIHSEIDADGIDYVMRDATFSGTSYGGFELGLLLRNLVVTKYHGVDIVGIRPKGISVIDQFLMSKYFAYTQVIYNRHVAIFDCMAAIFTKAIIKISASDYPNGEELDNYVRDHNSNDRFLKFTDREFWSQLDHIRENDLQTLSKENVVTTHKKLSHYQEFEMAPDGEMIITSDDPQKAEMALKNTGMYQRLVNRDEKRLMLFHSREFTSEITDEEFIAGLKRINKTYTDDDYIKSNRARLQEGISVIEEGKDPVLLVDNTKSIMSYLHGTRTYIFREYLVE